MRLGRWLLLLHLLIFVAGCRDDLQGQSPASRSSREQEQRQLANELRRSARGLVLVRRVLRWYALTGREPARTAEQLQGIELWLTPERLFALRRLENSAGLKAAQRRRLRYLRSLLLLTLLEREAALQDDRHVNLLARETVKIPGAERPVRFNDLNSVLQGEERPERREALQALRTPALGRLDALVELKFRRVRQRAKRLGVSYFELLEEHEERDSRSLLVAAAAHNRSGRLLLDQALRAVVPGGKLRSPTQLRFLLQGGALQPRLREALILPSLERLLQGLGMRLQRLRLSRRGLATAAVPVAPPGDVRLAYQPNSGLQDYVKLFEAAGRAICWSRVDKSRSWESRNLGPRMGPRALGYLLGLVWLEPRWWQVFGELRGEEERPDVSGPTPEQINDLLRTQLLASLLRLRVEGLVIPAVRAELEGAPSRVTEAVWGRSRGGAAAARGKFTRLMRAWVGTDLTDVQQLGYVDYLNPLLESFDLRAYALAHQLQEQLRREQGEAWFERPEVGRRLLQGLCVAGSDPTDKELVRQVGLRELDLDAPWRNLALRWKALHRGGE